MPEASAPGGLLSPWLGDGGAPSPPDASAEPMVDDADAAAPSSMEESFCGVRLLDSQLHAGMLDGTVHAQQSALHSVLLARHAPTRLDIWNGEIELGAVCDYPVRWRVDQRSSVRCMSCDQPTTIDVCRLDDPPLFEANACKALTRHPAACEPPLPEPTQLGMFDMGAAR